MIPERAREINPIFGMRITTGYDALPRGFENFELVKVINTLSETRHDYDMLMEAAQFDEVDSFYNPGTDEVPDDYVLEAIVVDKFSKTERRMAAVVRVLNRHLSDSEIKALDPIVGKPKKTGTYAYVTVQLPFSDGQVVSVIFHAPEGDKKKIGPSDQIIAFRWLLNKRDITQVVAPEDGSEISLESIAKRITQLVEKNSARFERTQKEAQAERQALDKAREDLKEAEERQRELMDSVAESSKESESVEAQLSTILAQLEKQKSINAELQAKLDAMRKTQPSANGGTSSTKTSTEGDETLIGSRNKGVGDNGYEAWGQELRKVFAQMERSHSINREQMKTFKSRITEYVFDALEDDIIPLTPDEYKTRMFSDNGNMNAETFMRSYQEYVELLNKYSPKIDEPNYGQPNDPFGQAWPEYIGKPEQAIEHLLKVKNGYVPGAFYKDGLGEIDLVWGNSKFGLEHIIERRNAQGLDGVAFARKIPEIIRQGHLEDDRNSNSKLIISDTDKAVVKLDWHTEKRTWLLTAYPLYETISGSAGTLSAEQTSGSRQSSSTTPETDKTLNLMPSFVNDLNDIIAGKYDADTDKIDALLDQTAAQAENEGLFGQYEDLFNQAADHLTELLKEKAARI